MSLFTSYRTLFKSDKKQIICGACESVLELDHSGIQCVQGHHFCTECSANIVRLFLSDPKSYIPIRCVQCHIELNPGVFERQLTEEQMTFYSQNMLILSWAQQILADDERLDHCPFCCFAVIRNKYETNIFFCLNPSCQRTSCLICRKECPKFETEYATDEQFQEMEVHFTCARLADDKALVDQQLELGQKVACPQCGLAGMKDNSCTHMTCPTCSQLWCYLCGKKVDDCDKAPEGDNGIYDHNTDWEFNSLRCPMYLTQIQEIDDRWPDDEEQCLAVFHRHRSLCLLRDLFQKMSQQRINELEEHFHIFNSCGFTMDEILNEDLTLIRRLSE